MTVKIFVAGSRQNAGKTTLCLGLLPALMERFNKCAFIKPVGQRWVEVDGVRVDKDAVLMKEMFGFDGYLKDMNPLTVESGITRQYIDSPDREAFESRIDEAFQRLCMGKDAVVIEGTGHAGVGSVLDLSNAQVAKRLDARVVLVVGAGIGRAIDDVWLNRCVFEHEGVRLAGVILNRCIEGKMEDVAGYVRKGLAAKGVELLGVIPDSPVLSSPSVLQVLMALEAELLSGEEGIGNPIRRIVVGAMSPHRALSYLGPGVLLITPGEREDLILAAMSSCVVGAGHENCVNCIMLTGGVHPHRTVMSLIERTSIPVMLVPHDSYTTASKVHDLVTKIRPTDRKKISMCRRLVRRHVDMDRLVELVGDSASP